MYIKYLTFFLSLIHSYQVAIRSYLLGMVFSCGTFGLLTSLTTLNEEPSHSPYSHFAAVASLYLMCLSMFHFTEYAVFALVNPDSATIDSFLLDHSIAYKIAMAASCVEFALGIHFFPGL